MAISVFLAIILARRKVIVAINSLIDNHDGSINYVLGFGMKSGVTINAIQPSAGGKAGSLVFEEPVFETIEDFEVESKLHMDGTKIRVRLRRQLNHKSSRFTRGPYWLDLTVGSIHQPFWNVSEATAREAACRFLLKYAEGVAPTVN
ncbi:hypothetical protein [uncultured Paraburkholderia sp.]|uniref:hypothetical protein n=1 Tax=uncultured Paraburkholderia sp. TaxID=1822466 RepID=UPI002593A60E|nr:hypothetical protein [uncultured Paraburkholderia sp.]